MNYRLNGIEVEQDVTGTGDTQRVTIRWQTQPTAAEMLEQVVEALMSGQGLSFSREWIIAAARASQP